MSRAAFHGDNNHNDVFDRAILEGSAAREYPGLSQARTAIRRRLSITRVISALLCRAFLEPCLSPRCSIALSDSSGREGSRLPVLVKVSNSCC